MKQLHICTFAGLVLVSIFMSDAEANENCAKVFRQFAAELASIASAYKKMTEFPKGAHICGTSTFRPKGRF